MNDKDFTYCENMISSHVCEDKFDIFVCENINDVIFIVKFTKFELLNEPKFIRQPSVIFGNLRTSFEIFGK